MSKSSGFKIPHLRDLRVQQALNAVPRDRFVPEAAKADAYADRALPIGYGQTISQPLVVGTMTDLLEPEPGDRILEIGTGSGYQSAVLSPLVHTVFTVERVPELQEKAKALLLELGVHNVVFRLGDGCEGWPEMAPFDGIIATAATPEIPKVWLDQLKPGGRLVAPVGPLEGPQDLVVIIPREGRTPQVRRIWPVKFVPLIHG
jgi:protein-L-isoaspartate(D-aspartate) O-methyltransferase